MEPAHADGSIRETTLRSMADALSRFTIDSGNAGAVLIAVRFWEGDLACRPQAGEAISLV
jgi:hypothetical protein